MSFELFPVVQWFDNSGNPLAGGKLFTYTAGTSTPQSTFTDSTGGTPNANPTILDAAGRAQLWFSAAAYKIVLQTSAGATLMTIDNVQLDNLAATISSLTMTGALTMQQSTAATSGANQSSNVYSLQGTFWNGSASGTDQWQIQDVMGTGSNPTATLSITHSGSSGAATIQVPNINNLGNETVGGTLAVTGNSTLSGDVLISTGKVIKWNADTGISRDAAGVIDIGNGTQGDKSGRMRLDGGNSQVTAVLSVRNSTAGNYNQIEFGHSNQSGFGSTIGANAGDGLPWIAFFAESGSTVNTFRTRGQSPVIIKVTGAGAVAIGTVASSNADNQAFSPLFNFNTSGALTAPNATDTLVGKTTTDTLTNKTLTGASSGNAVTLLNWQSAAAPITGNGADQTIYTFTIPANTMGAGKGIYVLAGWQHTTGAAAVQTKFKFGATTVATNSESGTGLTVVTWCVMNNPGVTNAQTAWQEIGEDAGSAVVYSPQVATPAENTTGAVVISVTFNVANTDAVTPKFFKVELVQ